MRIVQLVPGSGGRFYCENCDRDDGLIKGLRARGHDVHIVPLYLPVSSEYPRSEGETPIFYGAVNLYIRHILGPAPGWLKRIFDSRALLGVAGRFAGSTDAGELGDLTISMLDGGDVEELERLIEWLALIRPDVIHLSNGLLIGLAPAIRQRLGVPVVCSLQDEHSWLDSLSDEIKRETAWSLLGKNAAAVDLFLPVSRFYAEYMTQRIGLPEDRIRIVPVGIDMDGFPEASSPLEKDGKRIIGYMSNISREMGFGLLAEAFMILKRSEDFRDLGLAATGGYSSHRYMNSVLTTLQKSGQRKDVRIVPSFGRNDRIRFLSGLSLVCVPVLEGEAFGTFILEALAAGIPVVQPNLGGFTELVDTTRGGILYRPNTPAALAATLARALRQPQRLRELGEAGRKAVRFAYTVDCMAEAMEEAFTIAIERTKK